MTTPNIKITSTAGFLDWVSPGGVITGGAYAGRVVVIVLFMLVPFFVYLAIPANLYEDGQLNDTLTAIVGISVLALPIGVWMLLTNTTKHYRTRGVRLPFFFALITPMMPVMFFFTWLFSSKDVRERNLLLAEQQRELRQRAKAEQIDAMSNDVPKPPSETISKVASSPVQYTRNVALAKDNPTVRRRR
jgi:hypothetical protein